MGGTVSTQHWDDLINEDFAKNSQHYYDPRRETDEDVAEVLDLDNLDSALDLDDTGNDSVSELNRRRRQTALANLTAAQNLPRKSSHMVFLSLESKGNDMSNEYAEFQLTHDPANLSIREIYEIFQSAHNKKIGSNWALRPMLYVHCAALLQKRGEPVMADLIFHAGLKVVEDQDVISKLRLGKAAALVQTRSTKEAIKLLQGLPLKIQNEQQDALNLFGRCYKDMAAKFGASPEKRIENLKKSFRYYNACFEKSDSYYPGINAATVAFLLHETTTARALAASVKGLCAKELNTTNPGEDYWVQATLGECSVILGEWDTAQKHYELAMQATGVTNNMRQSTRRQFRMLMNHVTSGQTPVGDKEKFKLCSESIEEGFRIPNVVLFLSNKMLKGEHSAADEAAPSDTVKANLDKLLEENNAGYCFSCAHAGPDLAFCEAVLRRGAELYVVLPFDRDVFRRAFYATTPLQAKRFDYIVQQANKVEICNDMTKDVTPINYQYGCYWTAGLAKMKSQLVDTTLIRIHVPRPKASSDQKWSANPWVVDQWRARKEKFIEWQSAHRVPETSPKSVGKNRHLKVPRRRSVLMSRESGPPQIIKAILFADVVGFSKMHEHEVFFFVQHFLGKAADLIQSVQPELRPSVRNTWGDAFYFVFDSVRAGGVFSLLLRDLVNDTAWVRFKLPETLSIRISMHGGPVFPCVDRVLDEQNFTGVHTSRAARIEPITAPGSVYCSRAFAALTTALDENEFSCEFIGNVPLAKKYGLLPVHVVEWKLKRKGGYEPKISKNRRTVPFNLRRCQSDSAILTRPL